MKKFIMLFVLGLALTLFISWFGAGKDVTVTVVEGTGNGYENIFDNNVNTKWSVDSFDGAYVIWELSDYIKPAVYTIVTSPDTSKNVGCIPESWTLYASSAAEVPEKDSEEWQELMRVENDIVLNSGDLSERYFYVEADGEYRYYMLVIDEIESGSVMELAEFTLQYMGFDYSYRPTGTKPHPTMPSTTQVISGTNPNTTTDPLTTTGTFTTTDPYTTTGQILTVQPVITTTSQTITTTASSVDALEEMAQKNSKYYFYRFLTENEKVIYNQMCLAAENYDAKISAPAAKVPNSAMSKVIDFLRYDHPEYFWLKNCSWSYNVTTNYVTSVSMKYCYPKSSIASMQQKIDSEVAKICSGLTASSTDYEVVVAAFNGIIDLVDYDTLTLEATEGIEQGETEPDELRNIWGVFNNRKVVCAGYAKAMQYILYKYGIECAYISNGDHAWNLVKLDGEYYYVDSTWGDPSNTDPDEDRDGPTDYSMLCMTTEDLEALESHEIPSDITVPECTATKYNYFIYNDLYFDYYDADTLQELFDESFESGRGYLTFQCADESTYEEITEDLFDYSAVWDYVNSAIDNTGSEKPDTVWNGGRDELYNIYVYYTY